MAGLARPADRHADLLRGQSQPGHELHTAKRGGNLLLRDAFEAAHGSPADRLRVPPCLLFERAAPGRAVRFRGLLAPGSATLTSDDELAAIWRSKGGSRFQNYRARFTVSMLRRFHAPGSTILCKVRTRRPGIAPRRGVIGSKAARTKCWLRRPPQLSGRSPSNCHLTLLALRCCGPFTTSSKIDRTHSKSVPSRSGASSPPRRDDVMSHDRARDGGSDAIGEYLLGPLADRVPVDFALEAKCYAPTTSVGVRDVRRLVSRLRHRNFGVFVTLSYFNDQVYSEVREDGHPIAMICG